MRIWKQDCLITCPSWQEFWGSRTEILPASTQCPISFSACCTVGRREVILVEENSKSKVRATVRDEQVFRTLGMRTHWVWEQEEGEEVQQVGGSGQRHPVATRLRTWRGELRGITEAVWAGRQRAARRSKRDKVETGLEKGKERGTEEATPTAQFLQWTLVKKIKKLQHLSNH